MTNIGEDGYFGAPKITSNGNKSKIDLLAPGTKIWSGPDSGTYLYADFYGPKGGGAATEATGTFGISIGDSKDIDRGLVGAFGVKKP